MYYQDAIFEIRPSGDYLHIVCTKCEEACEMDFRGRDPVMVNLKSSVRIVKAPATGNSTVLDLASLPKLTKCRLPRPNR